MCSNVILCPKVQRYDTNLKKCVPNCPKGWDLINGKCQARPIDI